MSGQPVAGVDRFVEDVGRRLRDLPRAERGAIETDLGQHVRETGAATYRECVERLGPPERYAAGLREGMGLAPYRRSRTPLLVAALAVAVVAAATIAWRVTRPEPVADDFAPFTVGSWSASGTDVRVAGGMLIALGDEPGTARMAFVVSNASDRALQVERIGLTTVRTLGTTSTYGGDASEPLRPGEIEISSIWDIDVRIEPIADPADVTLGEHGSIGAAFAPFEWQPGAGYVVSLDGPVAACSDELAALDGRGGPVSIAFSVGDHAFELQVLSYAFDTRAC